MEQNQKKLGSSLEVPIVQELAKKTLATVPPRYIRILNNPDHNQLSTSSSPEIPVIDFHKFFDPDLTDFELRKLHNACHEWGFFQILANGIYRSIEHQATVSSEKERLSIATFIYLKLDGEVGPAPSLVGPENPAKFKTLGVADFLRGFLSKELKGKSYLDTLRI